MSNSSPLLRSVYGLGAATVLTLTLTGPASALPGPPAYNTWKTADAVTVLVPIAPAPQPYSPGPPSYNSTWPGWSPPAAVNGAPEATASPTDTLQYLQIGLGALSGALLSAGALTVLARTHRGRLTHA